MTLGLVAQVRGQGGAKGVRFAAVWCCLKCMIGAPPRAHAWGIHVLLHGASWGAVKMPTLRDRNLHTHHVHMAWASDWSHLGALRMRTYAMHASGRKPI